MSDACLLAAVNYGDGTAPHICARVPGLSADRLMVPTDTARISVSACRVPRGSSLLRISLFAAHYWRYVMHIVFPYRLLSWPICPTVLCVIAVRSWGIT